MNITDYYGRGASWVSSGTAGALAASAIVGNGRLGLQWGSAAAPVLDRIFYGATVAAETGATATHLFLFDSGILPGNGAIAAGSNFVLDIPIAAAPSTAVFTVPPAGAHFINGICIVGSTTAFPTLTIGNANLVISVYYDRAT